MQGSSLYKIVFQNVARLINMGLWTAVLLALAVGLLLFALTACRLIG